MRFMQTLERRFEVPVGFSDHTTGSEAAVTAVALGASMVEKHFTLDRSLPGPDHAMSLEPTQLASRAGDPDRGGLLGSAEKVLAEDELRVAKIVVAVRGARAIDAGEALGDDNVV